MVILVWENVIEKAGSEKVASSSLGGGGGGGERNLGG